MTFDHLGDQAVIVRFPDEPSAVRFAARVRSANPTWLDDVVPAYTSVGVFFDADRVRSADVLPILYDLVSVPDSADSELRVPNSALHTIPVCYGLGPDLARVAAITKLAADDVVRLHTGTEYAVHAIGFVPGFPYLGYLPEALQGVGRLAEPRVRVEPGSVGVTGKQTGIYSLARPGGWHLIGRTPMTMVDVAAGYFPLRVGDRVRFEPISESEFRDMHLNPNDSR